jgi:hypothetical protein
MFEKEREDYFKEQNHIKYLKKKILKNLKKKVNMGLK